MAVFEQSGFSNLTNVTQLLEVAELFSNGWLGFGIWLLILFGTFFILSSYSTKESFIGASFVSLISAILLSYFGILAGEFVITSIVLFVIAIVMGFALKNSMGA